MDEEEKPIIGIIGFGVVGSAVASGLELSAKEVRVYDIDERKRTHSLEDTCKSDIVYITVPTPMKENGEIDLSIVDGVMEKCNEYAGDNSIIMLKSTVIPGTTELYQNKYPRLTIVFNPEFLTMRASRLDFINPSRIILGTDSYNIDKIKPLIRFLRERFPGTAIYLTDSAVAELTKYTANAFFAVKVSFFNEIYQIANRLGISYKRLIKLVLADGRIGNSHWEVPGHDRYLGFGGSCFPKDINAIIKVAESVGIDPKVMKAAWEKNLEVREVRDWEKKKD